MKKYKLLIYGKVPQNLEKIRLSFQMLTYGIYRALKKLNNVELLLKDVDTDPIESLPNADFILVINYNSFFVNKTYYNLLKSKYKKVMSFMENTSNSDWSFTFKPSQNPNHNNNYEIIPAPYLPEFNTHEKKLPKSILIDHFWLNWIKNKPEMEWSYRIYDWLKDLKDEFDIYCLVRHCIDKNGKDWAKIQLEKMPSYIKPLDTTYLKDYYEKTKKFENFIVTHSGSYNYSVVDMISRGTRVFTRPGFIPEYNLKLFHIPYFRNQTELIKKLQDPYDEKYWNEQVNKCTPMDQCAKIIDQRIQSWM